MSVTYLIFKTIRYLFLLIITRLLMKDSLPWPVWYDLIDGQMWYNDDKYSTRTTIKLTSLELRKIRVWSVQSGTVVLCTDSWATYQSVLSPVRISIFIVLQIIFCFLGNETSELHVIIVFFILRAGKSLQLCHEIFILFIVLHQLSDLHLWRFILFLWLT